MRLDNGEGRIMRIPGRFMAIIAAQAILAMVQGRAAAQIVPPPPPLQIVTPLGPGAFVLEHAEGTEAINQTFEYLLDVRTSLRGIDPAALIGQSISFSAPLQGGGR